MNYRASDNHIKTMDAAVRFLAGSNHQNVAKLFHKSGYTCELEAKGGTFFESVILNKRESRAELTLYWGISIRQEHRDSAEKYIKKINAGGDGFCSLGVDASGRFFSKAAEAYENEAISPNLFEAMEQACIVSLDKFYETVESLNSGKAADDRLITEDKKENE